MPATDEPDRSPRPPKEAEDQPPPQPFTQHRRTGAIETHLEDASRSLTRDELATLEDLTQRVLALLPNAGSVRVRIVDDAEMTRAHKRFSGIGSTTDVLTFDLAADTTDHDAKALDTDLIICADEARRQAAARAHPLAHELLLYIVHGTLHCLGHDDHSEEEYQRMHRREDELLNAAGIGAVFAAQETTPDTTPTEEAQS